MKTRHVIELASTVLAFLATPGLANTLATSPTIHANVTAQTHAVPRATNTVTFSEFPLSTVITTQYQPQGVVFVGNVFIASDASNPTSPVLSGSPMFTGPIEGHFVVPATGLKRTVRHLELDAGYFNNVGSTSVTIFNKRHKTLASVLNTNGDGIEHFTFNHRGIYGFVVQAVGADASGFAVDNVTFSAPLHSAASHATNPTITQGLH